MKNPSKMLLSNLKLQFSKINYESLCKYKVGIYLKFHHLLREKIFEINNKIKISRQICPRPGMNRVNNLSMYTLVW